MTPIIFVHGTGGRQESYTETLATIHQALRIHWESAEQAHKTQRLDPDQLKPCLWGDSCGARLHANGQSIPNYDNLPGKDELTPEERERKREEVLWNCLFKSPFIEMLLLPDIRESNRDLDQGRRLLKELLNRVENFRDSCGEMQLNTWGLTEDLLQRACNRVTESTSFAGLRYLITERTLIDEDYDMVARAIVAQSQLLCKENNRHPKLERKTELRNQAVREIRKRLDNSIPAGGIDEDISRLLEKVYLGIGIHYASRKWGAIFDSSYPLVGDVLLYQAKGKEIRNYIHDKVAREIKNNNGLPVILLAHSLGGIACTEMLIENPDLRQNIQCLVTVGSQVPFLYEINALQTLDYGKPLPDDFPRWLNIYSPQDILSHVGREVFGERFTDVMVTSRKIFPESHGDYWENTDTWRAIINFLNEIQQG